MFKKLKNQIYGRLYVCLQKKKNRIMIYNDINYKYFGWIICCEFNYGNLLCN